MKKNRIDRSGHRRLKVVSFLVAFAFVAVGLWAGYARLRALWEEQCVVRDMSSQVFVTSGKMVKGDVLAEFFGLRVGANLAKIDFAARRTEILRRVPNLRDVAIRLSLPDRVTLVAEERVPVARLGIRGRRTAADDRVVDAEGVVFRCAVGTRLLPVIRESHAPGTAAGHRLNPRTAAALEFVLTCREAEFADFNLLEVDVSKPDFLLATLGTSYATVKLAWEDMDAHTPDSHAGLLRQLTHLKKAMASRVGDEAVVWNATDFSRPGRIYADTKGNLK